MPHAAVLWINEYEWMLSGSQHALSTLLYNKYILYSGAVKYLRYHMWYNFISWFNCQVFLFLILVTHWDIITLLLLLQKLLQSSTEALYWIQFSSGLRDVSWFSKICFHFTTTRYCILKLPLSRCLKLACMVWHVETVHGRTVRETQTACMHKTYPSWSAETKDWNQRPRKQWPRYNMICLAHIIFHAMEHLELKIVLENFTLPQYPSASGNRSTLPNIWTRTSHTATVLGRPVLYQMCLTLRI